jgi:hypothetical protein
MSTFHLLGPSSVYWVEPEADLIASIASIKNQSTKNEIGIDIRQKHASHVIYDSVRGKVTTISGFFSNIGANDTSANMRKVVSNY